MANMMYSYLLCKEPSKYYLISSWEHDLVFCSQMYPPAQNSVWRRVGAAVNEPNAEKGSTSQSNCGLPKATPLITAVPWQ